MRIVGINLSHDGSACVLEDGHIRVALGLERVVRVRRGILPAGQLTRAMGELLDYCLAACGDLTVDDIDYFVGTTTESSSDEEEAMILRDVGYFPRSKMLALPHPSHHLAHACAAFYGSSFESAAALVVDAYGSLIDGGRETETAFWFDGTSKPQLLFRNRRPTDRVAGVLKGGRLIVPRTLYGIGEIYRVVTLALGFRQGGTYYDDPGKTMGLAPFGKRLSDQPQMIQVVNGELDFANAYGFLRSLGMVSEEGGVSYINEKSGDEPFSQFHSDLACQVQWEFEEACLHLVRKLLNASGSDTVVLGGGSFLNAVANHRILSETGVRRLFVFPAATDDGNSIGAAWYAHHFLAGARRPRVSHRRRMTLSLGRIYSDEEIGSALQKFECSFAPLPSQSDAAQMAAERLAAGKIIGWFQGGAEFGPRALGNRSILANPCSPGIQDRVNSFVKFREGFRPFAGAVLEEQLDRFFELRAPVSPYMLLVCPVREEVRKLVPGVTHVDGTCRVQTVGLEDDPLLYELIARFGQLTGVPIVLNTSFNLRGMPIVETPLDALHCLFATQMDGLFIGRFAVNAPDYGSFVPALCSPDMSIYPAASEAAASSQFIAKIQSGDTGASSVLTPFQAALLRLIDGRRPVYRLAEGAGVALASAITELLVLYRKRLLYWLHLGPMRVRKSFRGHFNLSPS
jgi:carbamoyltransferase